MEQLGCEYCGELNEHVGFKIERRGDILKMPYPVLVQSLEDELGYSNKTSGTLPVSVGTELKSEGDLMSVEEKKVCRSGVSKTMFLMRHSRPDVLHVVREISRWTINGATIQHKKTMYQTMK